MVMPAEVEIHLSHPTANGGVQAVSAIAFIGDSGDQVHTVYLTLGSPEAEQEWRTESVESLKSLERWEAEHGLGHDNADDV